MNVNKIDLHVGKNLRLCRISKNLDVDEAASKQGVLSDNWKSWESGETRITAGDMWGLQKNFNIAPSDLFAGLADLADT